MIEAGGVLLFLSLISFLLYFKLSSKERSSQLKELIALETQGAKERSRSSKKTIKIPMLDIIEINLTRAGLGKNVPGFMVSVCISMAITYFIGEFYMDYTLGMMTALAGPYIVWNYVKGRINKRADLMLVDFKEFLRYVASYLAAGVPFAKAIEKAANKIGNPLKMELLTIVKDIRGGQTIDKALKDGTKRIPMEEYNTFVMVTEINMAIGGNLSHIYEKIATDIDKKIKRRDNVKAYTAQGRLTTKVVGAIPFVVVAFIRLYSPEFYEPVANDSVWKVTYIGSIVSIVFGIYMVNRMTASFAKGVS